MVTYGVGTGGGAMTISEEVFTTSSEEVLTTKSEPRLAYPAHARRRRSSRESAPYSLLVLRTDKLDLNRPLLVKTLPPLLHTHTPTDKADLKRANLHQDNIYTARMDETRNVCTGLQTKRNRDVPVWQIHYLWS